MRNREREQWVALVADLHNRLAQEADSHRKERQELLNRIAAPERLIVDPIEREPIEPSKDTEELAYVGQEAPGTFRHPDDGDDLGV